MRPKTAPGCPEETPGGTTIAPRKLRNSFKEAPEKHPNKSKRTPKMLHSHKPSTAAEWTDGLCM
eukprot:4493325-Pyramimonas_sp.AAC.1